MHIIDSLRRAAKAPEPYAPRTPEGGDPRDITPQGSLRPWCPKCGLSILEVNEGCYRCGPETAPQQGA